MRDEQRDEEERDRPDHVELLLDGKRPHVQEGALVPGRLEVVARGDEVPVRDVPQRCSDVGPKASLDVIDASRAPHAIIAASTRTIAGARRRTRRVQKSTRRTLPLSTCLSRIQVMRKPLRTKKRSTPRNPACAPALGSGTSIPRQPRRSGLRPAPDSAQHASDRPIDAGGQVRNPRLARRGNLTGPRPLRRWWRHAAGLPRRLDPGGPRSSSAGSCRLGFCWTWPKRLPSANTAVMCKRRFGAGFRRGRRE